MKKRILSLLLVVALLLLTACAKAPTWQEQYDLGLRYLSEGNYQEAVIAFAAAIEIDDRQPAAYAGLAEAYRQSGDLEKAREALQQGLAASGDARFESLLDELDQLAGQNEQDEQGEPDEPTGQSTPDGQDPAVNEETAEFAARAHYRAFDSLTAQEQEYIAYAAAAAMDGDDVSFRVLASFSVWFETPTYTLWNDYKVCIHSVESRWEDDEGQMQADWVCIELRPQNGVGYYASLELEGPLGAPAREERTVTIACPCENWQWNGDFSGTVNSLRTVDDGEITYGDVSTYETITGVMQDSVRQGTVVTEVSQYSTLPDEEGETRYRREEVYEDGVRTDYVVYEDGAVTYEWDESVRAANADNIWGIGSMLNGDEDRYW